MVLSPRTSRTDSVMRCRPRAALPPLHEVCHDGPPEGHPLCNVGRKRNGPRLHSGPTSVDTGPEEGDGGAAAPVAAIIGVAGRLVADPGATPDGRARAARPAGARLVDALGAAAAATIRRE